MNIEKLNEKEFEKIVGGTGSDAVSGDMIDLSSLKTIEKYTFTCLKCGKTEKREGLLGEVILYKDKFGLCKECKEK